MRTILIITSLLIFYSCNQNEQKHFSLINTKHLDHLYEEIAINNHQAAIIHIYAEYPDYTYREAPEEGITCVDDVARAVVFYINQYKQKKQLTDLTKSEKLIRSILEMQSDNGFFYNFMYNDLSINKTHINSEARPNWWTWRALWALAEALPVFSRINPVFAEEIEKAIKKTVTASSILKQNYPKNVDYKGFRLPGWLPLEFAADQASVLVKGLIPYYQYSSDPDARKLIQIMAEGIRVMQIGDSINFPFNVFMSWKNLWHAYGNSQSDALLEVGDVLKDKSIIISALNEIRYFYPYLINEKYLNFFTLKIEEGQYHIEEKQQFAQIAYGIRPMVFASLGAFHLTGVDSYSKQAAEFACWLLGKNVTGKMIYDPQTGRCFDGINKENEVNYNSGAESTIEALLILQAIENVPASRDIVYKYYQDMD